MSFAALTIDLNARLAKFEQDMARAGKSLDGLNSRAAAAAASLKTSFGALGVGLSVGAFAAFAKSGIDAADAMNDMSARLGVSVKDLASFKLAAEQSGTSLDGVGIGIAKLTKSIGEAEAGNKSMSAALQGLGITARDPKEAFFQLADAVQRIEDPSKRAALLSQVLGKSYGELVPLLSQGGEALRKSARESESFADAMARLAPDADKFNDNLSTLKINAAGAAGELLTKLVPGLAETASRVNELLSEDHGVLALGRALAGIGKIPFDLLLGDPFKPAATAAERIKELNVELGNLQRKKDSGGGLLMKKLFGAPEDIDRQIAVIKNQIAVLEKFGDKIYKPKPGAANASPDRTNTPSGVDGGGKSDPQAAFVAKLRDEAATLGMGSEALLRYEALKLKLTGTNARLAEGYIEQISAFKGQQAAADANNKAFDEYLKKEDDANAARENSIKSLREWIAEQEFEVSLFGKSNAEREAAIRLRALEATGIDTQTESFRKLHDQLVAISEEHALDSLISDTTVEKTRSLHEKVAILDRALLDGKITTEQWNEAFDKFNGGKKFNDLDTFAKNAAKNIQNSFADFLFDPFDKGVKGLAEGFGTAMKRMVAEAVAADLARKLFGGLSDNGKTQGNGWAGAALDWIGGLLKFDGGGYTGDGVRSGGLDGKGGFLAVMHPRETVLDHTRGQGVGGGNTYVVHVHGANSAQDVRRAAGQGMREAVGFMEKAGRYV